MNLTEVLNRIINLQDLTEEEMAAVMHIIVTGGATAAQIAGLLVALRIKGETVSEITAAANVLRSLATKIDLSDLPWLIDIVGTGGDGAGIFNVSTSSIFVAAAAGCHVAKHGNRSVSSSSGAADVLETAGVKLNLSPDQVARCVREVGVGFLFAPLYHEAMRYAITPRRELGVRTLFNLLGPLINPAGVPNQVLGVFAKEWLLPLAEVLQRLGSQHVLVIHARDGLDEISINAPTDIVELKEGKIHCYSITPEQFGIESSSLTTLQVQNSLESLNLLKSVLANQASPACDIVKINAGAAIYTAGRAENLAEGIEQAKISLASGEAEHRFQRLINF